MSDQTCTHGTEKGGVHTNWDPYGTRRKLTGVVKPWEAICWPCWKAWGEGRDKMERAAVDQLPIERGLCGFLEAWVGHCLKSAPCAKHIQQRCWFCKEPATQNCAETFTLVCGVPECAKHPHIHHREVRKIERVLICGSRTWTDESAIAKEVNALPSDAIVIHGGALGADSIAGRLAKARGLEVRVFEARWDLDGKAAGPIRNSRMLREGMPTRVIAFRRKDKVSKGTDDMIRRTQKAGIPYEVIYG